MFGTLSAISFAFTGITRSMMENVSPWFAAAASGPCVKQGMAKPLRNPIQNLRCSLDRLGFLPTSSSSGLLCSRWDGRSIQIEGFICKLCVLRGSGSSLWFLFVKGINADFPPDCFSPTFHFPDLDLFDNHLAFVSPPHISLRQTPYFVH